MSCFSCSMKFGDDCQKVRCSACWLWFHLDCTSLKKKPGPNEAFICRKCKNDQSALTQQFGLLETAVKNQSEFMEKYKQEKDDTLKKVVENQTSVIEQLQLTKNENALYVKRQALQKLPKFNGNTKEWPRFKAIYEKTSTEGSFSKLENATRLLDALSGDALNLVGSQLVNPDNVENAFKSLEKYFGNSDMIYDSLVQELCATKPIKNGNHDAFVSFTIAVVNVVENLKLMGMASRLDDTRLVRELMMKLPPPQQERWISFAAEKQSKKLDTFSQFLELRTSVLNELRIAGGSSSSNPAPSTSKGPVYVQSELKPKPIKRCHLCKLDNHDIDSCKKFKAMSVKDRWNKVKELNLCFGCLNRAYHRLAECRKSQKCDINGCTRFHSKLLHFDENQNEARSDKKEWRRQEPRKEPEKEKEKSKEPKDEGSNTNLIHSENSLLMILPVTVEANGIAEDTYAFLDPGSKFSLIETHLADRLKLEGTKETLTMVCAKRKVVTEEHSIRTSLTISGRGKDKTYHLNDIRTVSNIGLPKGYQNASEIVKSSSRFKGIPLPSFRNVQPTILIGANNPKLLMQIESIEHPSNSLMVTKTRLGWCALGNDEKTESTAHNFMITGEEDEINLHDLVKSYFTTENFGVMPLLEDRESKNDLRAKQIVDKTLRKLNNRYEVGLLWKNDNIVLPDSYPMALKRFLSEEARMNRDMELKNWYRQTIKDYIEKGYCRVLSHPDEFSDSPRKWFIPFFHVVNKNKTPVKRRMVFDAAAKVKGISLNSTLLPGPNKYASMVGVLFKAREGNILVVGDIKEMFPQVKIRPEDQAAQMFLFRFEDGKDIVVLVMTSMIFGNSCSPYLSQEVKHRNAMQYINEFPRAVWAIINQEFVDDHANSFENVEEAIEVTSQVIRIHARAGFELRNFVSNSQEVINALPNAEEARKQISLDFEAKEAVEKILGIYWNPTNDEFGFKINTNRILPDIFHCKRSPTKRELLKFVMSIFDPLGLLSHILIRPKLLIQKTWRANIDWDQPLTPILFEEWKSWMRKFQEIEKFKIARAYVPDAYAATRSEMHTFCDASENVMCAVVFFRFIVHGEIKVALVTSKTKVAPNKVLSIPRLELQAALLGSRLARTAKLEHRLKIDEKFFYSDSGTVLAQILNDDPQNFKPFVAVRLGEIHTLTNPSEWKKISSADNVADDATKWTDDSNYDINSRWFNGPSFLHLPQEKWPDFTPNNLPTPTEKRKPVYVLSPLQLSYKALPDQNFQSFLRAKKVLAYVKIFFDAFVRICRKYRGPIKTKLKQLPKNQDRTTPIITFFQMNEAEAAFIRKAQMEGFPQEYAQLYNGQQVSKKSNIFPLSPFLDDKNIIRMESRIKAAPRVPAETVKPIILPNKHRVTDLIIQHHHEKFAHQFRESVIAATRQKYWIVHTKVAVRRVISNCQVCKNRKAQPIATLMGQLPRSRLDYTVKPFTYSGVDCFGPMEVAIFRRRIKCWGVLFTCCVVRAVHIELVMSMSADDFILSLRNFLNRHGPVLEMYSDNGTNFSKANRILIEELNRRKSELDGANNDTPIKWHFNPPTGSHFGGIFESLIKSIKSALEIVLKEQAPRIDTLRSALIECENIVNSRPLTAVPLEPDDEEPITPNHFLKGNPNCLPSPGIFNPTKIDLRKQWKISQQYADKFWHHWRLKYLPTLARRTKWHEQTPELEVGDTVLMVDDNAPRNEWKMCRVVNKFYGPDNICRVVEVCWRKDWLEKSKKVYTRPITKLVKLDVNCN